MAEECFLNPNAGHNWRKSTTVKMHKKFLEFLRQIGAAPFCGFPELPFRTLAMRLFVNLLFDGSPNSVQNSAPFNLLSDRLSATFVGHTLLFFTSLEALAKGAMALRRVLL